MILTSPYFENNNGFPISATCDGKKVNPPLDIAQVPKAVKSLALVLRDPDAPVPGSFVHWILWNINPKTRRIKQNSVPPGSVEGNTTEGRPGYVAACPPSGKHRYIFTLYALDKRLDLAPGAVEADLMAAMDGHVAAQAELMEGFVNFYGRKYL